MNSLGDRIRQLRKEKKLTQTELGNNLTIGKSTVSQYENNINTPDIEMMTKIADFFDVSIDFLLARSDNRKNTKEYEQEKIPPAFIKIAKDAYDHGLSPEDIEMAIDFLKKARQRDQRGSD